MTSSEFFVKTTENGCHWIFYEKKIWQSHFYVRWKDYVFVLSDGKLMLYHKDEYLQSVGDPICMWYLIMFRKILDLKDRIKEDLLRLSII